ncbi:MAG: hypothetical protein KBS96_00240 [Lachnospiraceae bacterium]|nr:hypothetical protein [Candidatus Colinaster scatohippi]
MEKRDLCVYTRELAIRAGKEEPELWAERFVEKIANPENERLLKEFEYYLNTGRFLCEYLIKGYTIADIIIWQMDHFKALLDDYKAMNKSNEYNMVLEGFVTMMQMAENPEPLVAKMQSTTGTDFTEKY